MGMAASQARLLSITSRMADNELRAQVINNSKMRLATESSRASEEYIDALNSATMMMSNYNTAGDSVYQKLTYNSLTAYSAYNNQYGLVNSYGQILVSEQEDQYYKLANGDVDEYLKLHGLEYKTTYFDTDGMLGTSVGFEDADGTVWETLDTAILKAMYEGNGTDTYPGYDALVSSTFYYDYNNYLDNLNRANYSVQEAIYTDMYEFFNDTTYQSALIANNSNVTDIKSGKLPDLATNSDGDVTYAGAQTGLTNIKNALNNLANAGLFGDNPEQNTLYAELTDMISMIDTNNKTITYTDTCIKNDDGTYSFGDYIIDDTTGEIYYEFTAQDNGNGSYTISVDNDYIQAAGCTYDNTSFTVTPDNDGNYTFSYTQTFTDTEEDGTTTTEVYNYKYTFNPNDNSGKGSATAVLDYNYNSDCRDVFISYVESMYQLYNDYIMDYASRDYFTNNLGAAGSTAATQWQEALYEMLAFIYGGEVSSTTDTNGVTTWSWSGNSSIYEYYNTNWTEISDISLIIQNNEAKGWSPSQDFEYLRQIYLLDLVFDTYGEPAYGWFDANDVNGSENADAKAQWYTNLFYRMQEGYKVLEDGLASSNEWIQFALESGLVTMEQVDSTNTWNATIYSNCSDITEVTDDVAVAKAEAVYNREMNNIENKDSRYDIELKNIDTEHDSLQTEYDSVKSVIDKNIERSFKIYS